MVIQHMEILVTACHQSLLLSETKMPLFISHYDNYHTSGIQPQSIIITMFLLTQTFSYDGITDNTLTDNNGDIGNTCLS